MRITTRRALAGMTALSAVVSVGLISLSTPAFAAPLANNAPPTAQANVAPATGVQALNTSMTLSLPNNDTVNGIVKCPGLATAPDNYRQRSFVMSRSTTVTPAALTYTGTGATDPGGLGITYVSNLWTNTSGVQLISANPGGSGPTAGLISNSYTVYLPQSIAPGQYWVGIACSKAGLTDGDYWSAPVTVSAAGWSSGWAADAAAVAPVLGSLFTDNGRIAGSFTTPLSSPANTALEVVVTPPAPGTPIVQALAVNATSFSVSSLTNGTVYGVQVRATNPIGSTLSNTLSGTPSTPTVTVPGGAATLAATGGTLTAFTASAPSVALPAGVAAPLGQFAFSATATTPLTIVTFNLTIPSPVTNVYKLVGSTWQNFTGLNAGGEGAVITGGTNIAISIRDNGAFDSNPVAGQVTDPIAAAVVASAGVGSLTPTAGAKKVTLDWLAPAPQVPALTGYLITAAPAGGTGTPSCSTPGTPIVLSPNTTTLTTFTVSNLTAGTLYCFTVTPTYPAPFVAASTSAQAAALGDGVIQQTISVVRPAGALKLTQRCAVTDGFPATTLNASTGFPGFPIINQTSGAAPVLAGGGAPTVVETTPGNSTAVGSGDNQFGDYPDPAAQTKTDCALGLGTAKLILTGSYKGQFYAASGAISQISVLDTRSTDSGWVITGSMSDFTQAGGSFPFSGNYLGWEPKRSSFSSSPTYTQAVTQGDPVLPSAAGTSVASTQSVSAAGVVVTAGTGGLGTSKILGYAPTPTATTGGLGLATLDARVNLLIPVTKPAGTYTGVLTFSAL